MRRHVAAAGAAIGALVATAGCAGSHDGPATPVAASPSISPTVRTTAPTPHRMRHHRHNHTAASPVATSTASKLPAFSARTASVTAAELGKSWHSGCPVGPSSLAALTVSTWGFDGRVHAGTLVVNRTVVPAFLDAFRSIYYARFPIRRMQPVAAYGGSDNRSMAADNTSAFNCRYAVSNGPKSWSMHAYGEAVDIDPLENPYRLDGKILPPAGAPYMDRSNVRPGMIVAGTAPVQAFAAVHWGWGGYWNSSPDYQHFSDNGR